MGPTSGDPNYFEPFVKPRHSVYETCRSQSNAVLFEVPYFASIYKSTKHFDLSFAYDAPLILNDLLGDVHSAKSLSSFRKNLFAKANLLQFSVLVSVLLLLCFQL